jgi:stearoyl-CoA desaturase (delta-9 desaturase)
VSRSLRPASSYLAESAGKQVPDIRTLNYLGIIGDERFNTLNRRHNAASIFIPLTGTVLAVVSLPWIGFTVLTAMVFCLFFFLTILGIELGLHRYFSHKAFRAGKILHISLALFASWAFQSPIVRWVADHRRHHRLSDQPYDTHSPYWIDGTPTGGIKGFYWAHFLWMLRGKASDEKRYAVDILADPVTSAMSRRYWLYAYSGILLPALIGYVADDVVESVRCLLWAGFVRVSLLQQFTWSVNSIGHSFGEILPGSNDRARNNVTLAVLTFGGGLHSYHHKFPAASVNRPQRWDLIGGIVVALEKTGLILEARKYPS